MAHEQIVGHTDAMGVTVHYSGQARSIADVGAITAIVRAFASTRRWGVQVVRGETLPLIRLINGQIEERDVTVVGIIVQPPAGSEGFSLLFDENLVFQSFTKTQFAPVEVHVSLCKLLREVQPMLAWLEVIDEGEYWSTGNVRTLIDKIGFLRTAINAMTERLQRDEEPFEG